MGLLLCIFNVDPDNVYPSTLSDGVNFDTACPTSKL
jgi:hypothetical protein